MGFPFEDRPEYDGGKEGRKGIYLTLHSTIPERIAECISKSTYYSGAHDGPYLSIAEHICHFNSGNSAGKMGNGPEQKQNCKTTGQCTHNINGTGGGKRIIAKYNDKETAQQYK